MNRYGAWFLAMWCAAAAAAQGPRDRQADDGRIRAPDGPERDVHLTALAGLSRIAEGSTRSGGRDRDVIHGAVRWLSGSADPHGRIGFAPHPRWLRDHALATAFLAEAAGSSDDPKLQRTLSEALDALATALGLPGLVDAETLWWSAWCVDAADRSGWFDAPNADRVDALESALRAALAALPAPTSPTDRRLLAFLRGEKVEPIPSADVPARDRFFAACHAFAVGGEPLRAFGRTMRAVPGLVARMHTGAWSETRAFDAMTLRLWNRYVQLPAMFGIHGMLADR